MTGSILLAAISAAILIQLGIFIGIAFWQARNRRVTAQQDALGLIATIAKGSWAGWRDFRVESGAFEDPARTQRSLTLAPVDSLPLPDFAPGQYLTFALDLPATPGPPKSIVRCYSLSEQPNPRSYRVTVKRMPSPLAPPGLPPGAASTFLHDGVQVGDLLKVKAPAGQFGIDGTADSPAVFIAGGIGVTPMISMISWALTHQPERRLSLFYGVRNGDDHAFKASLGQLALAHPNFTVHVVYGAPGPDDVEGRDFQHRGFIDVALLKRVLPHGRQIFYVCGPPPMMAALVPALMAWGVPKSDIHFESFGPASLVPIRTIAGPLEAQFAIQFRSSRRTVQWTGEETNLLDFAERHGIAVDSGCRTGSCGSCETRLVSGEVRYRSIPDFEVSAGACLMCVGVPASALVLEA